MDLSLAVSGREVGNNELQPTMVIGHTVVSLVWSLTFHGVCGC
jgi:hypothetical protein